MLLIVNSIWDIRVAELFVWFACWEFWNGETWRDVGDNDWFWLSVSFWVIDFIIKETDDGKPQLFANCLVEDFLECITCENIDEVFEIYESNEEIPIKSINNKNPFDFINDFGKDFLSTKNEHATFSFKLKNHNNQDLSDYPLSIEEFSQLDIEFESGDIINTKFYIGSQIDIENNERRNLNMKNKIKNKRRKNIKKKTKKRNLHNYINWYHK